MILRISDGRETRDPTADFVGREVQRVASMPDEFAILERKREEYVQVSAGVLEYRDAGGHFRAAQVPVAPRDVERVFLAFHGGGDAWRGLIAWQPADAMLERETAARSAQRNAPINWLIGIVAVALLLGAIWLLR